MSRPHSLNINYEFPSFTLAVLTVTTNWRPSRRHKVHRVDRMTYWQPSPPSPPGYTDNHHHHHHHILTTITTPPMQWTPRLIRRIRSTQTNKKYINDNWEESNVKYIKDLTYWPCHPCELDLLLILCQSNSWLEISFELISILSSRSLDWDQ